LKTPAELTALYPAFETESKYYPGYPKTIFTGFDNNDFNLTASNTKLIKPAVIPENIAKVMRLSNKQTSFIGASNIK